MRWMTWRAMSARPCQLHQGGVQRGAGPTTAAATASAAAAKMFFVVFLR